MEFWEFHPILVHFPIAFLLAGMAVEVWAFRKPRESLTRPAAGLLVAGVISGWLAAAAGLLAFWTVRAHTTAAHGEMIWHLWLAIGSLSLFSGVAWMRWRNRSEKAVKPVLAVGLVAAILLVVAGDFGGGLVYRGGAGVDPEILSAEIRGGHSHQNGDEGKSESEHGKGGHGH
ncbi:MAG: DUF2231 domain-containing protein [Planctomycetaceae bacterium]